MLVVAIIVPLKPRYISKKATPKPEKASEKNIKPLKISGSDSNKYSISFLIHENIDAIYSINCIQLF